jgi:hypothetical protein
MLGLPGRSPAALFVDTSRRSGRLRVNSSAHLAWVRVESRGGTAAILFKYKEPRPVILHADHCSPVLLASSQSLGVKTRPWSRGDFAPNHRPIRAVLRSAAAGPRHFFWP